MVGTWEDRKAFVFPLLTPINEVKARAPHVSDTMDRECIAFSFLLSLVKFCFEFSRIGDLHLNKFLSLLFRWGT